MSDELKKASAGGKFYGSILLFLVFALLFWFGGLMAPAWHYFFPGEKDIDAKRAEARAAKLEALQKENDRKLTTYAWVDKDKQIVQIPIAEAMKLVVADLAAKPVKASAVKLENPYPYPDMLATPAPSGTTSPAAAASGSAAPAASGTAASGSTAPTPAATGTIAPAPGVPAATPTPGQ